MEETKIHRSFEMLPEEISVCQLLKILKTSGILNMSSQILNPTAYEKHYKWTD